MSGKNHVLPRRALLRGAASVLLGLPLLEAMGPRLAHAAPAAGIPRRMVVSYAGTTHGPSRTMNPAAAGPLPTTFSAQCAALEPVRALVSMVSGLAIPGYTGTAVIPGGAYNMQHGGVMSPMLSGRHSLEHMAVMANGHTVDQIFADAVGTGTRLASVQASIQAAGYGGGTQKGVQSARLENGKVRGLAPITSPALLFSTLFGAAPGGGPATASSTNRDRSILDFVLGDANRLSGRVSAADRARLDQHFTEIRALETRLGTVPPVTASCTSPTAPGADPALGSPTTFGGWSNETLRGDLMADMIALALACDVTRAVSLMVSWDQSFLKTQDPTANYADMHAMGHSGTAAQIAYNANWHVGRFAKVVKRLSEMPEPGGTLLDSTFVAMLFAEGSNSHNKSDITALVAGIPSKLKMGQHVATGGAHPAKLMVSGLQALGLPATSLGEVNGNIPGLMV